jgi:hypothetical protein
MSTPSAREYRSRFTGRIAPAGSRKSLENKPFHGRWSTYSGKAHGIKDRVLLDETCGSSGFLDEYDARIVKVERGNAKYMEVNA